MPTARYGAGAGVVNGQTYVFGGYNNGFLSTAEVFGNTILVANPQVVNTHFNSAVLISLLATDADNDPLTFVIDQFPLHGTLNVLTTNGNVSYIPNSAYIGLDSFAFHANDGAFNSNTATVSINVTDAAPVASNQSLTVHTGIALPVVLSATDADNDALTFTIVMQPVHGTLSGTPPNVTYTSGAYTGPDSFTFKANDGALDSNIATVSINVADQPPVASLTAASTILIEGQSVAFNAGASNPGGDTLTYLWNFGDGDTSTDANPAHVYATAGTYIATLTVTNIAGQSVTQSITIKVFHDSDLPTARFVTSALNGYVGQPVGFDASFSTDPNNNIVSYDWDFGDGSPHGSQQIISRVYTATGTYTVTLTIIDGDGLTDTTSLTMVVLPASQAGLFSSTILYSVSWNRGATNSDSLSLSATVNVGTTPVTSTTPLSLGIVGQTFTGTSATKLSLPIKNNSGPQVKWMLKANTKKGAPKGTYALKCTIKHASLGQAFALAGVTGNKSASAKIPVNLGIGGSAFASSISSQFRFGSNGVKASGGGSGPK